MKNPKDYIDSKKQKLILFNKLIQNWNVIDPKNISDKRIRLINQWEPYPKTIKEELFLKFSYCNCW